MLIDKGDNVYPRELEEIPVAPRCLRAAMVGRDAGSAGEEPVAFVVPVDGQGIDAAAGAALVADRVLPYKKIRDVVITESLPSTPAGKIQQARLRERPTTRNTI